MYRIATTLGCLACLALTGMPAAAQLLWPGTAEVAQATAPRRAQPIPNKPISVNHYALKKFGFEKHTGEIERYVLQGIAPESAEVDA
ncbi:MAG: hypothetical protein EHM67_03855, partial [Hyphomicrobiaceae bacterium]